MSGGLIRRHEGRSERHRDLMLCPPLRVVALCDAGLAEVAAAQYPLREDQKSENTMTIQTGGKQILLHGLTLILAGLVFGFAPPLTPYPRLALGAHIQFVTNGMLFVVLAIVVLKVPHRAGPKSVGAMLVSAWLTWFMATPEVANAWRGASQVLQIDQQAGEVGRWRGRKPR